MTSLWKQRRLQQEYFRISEKLDNTLYAHVLAKTKEDNSIQLNENLDSRISKNYEKGLSILDELLEESRTEFLISTPLHNILTETSVSTTKLESLKNNIQKGKEQKTPLSEPSHSHLENLYDSASKKRNLHYPTRI